MSEIPLTIDPFGRLVPTCNYLEANYPRKQCMSQSTAVTLRLKIIELLNTLQVQDVTDVISAIQELTPNDIFRLRTLSETIEMVLENDSDTEN